MEMKNKIIVCKGWGWLWLSLFVLVLLAGIGFFLQIPQGKDDFEKAFMGVFGTFISFVGCAGILINLFGEKRADEIWNWIYGGFNGITCCCILWFTYRFWNCRNIWN